MKQLTILLLILLAVHARASNVSEATLRTIRFDQKLNTQVDLDLPFRDETGTTVKLGNYFGHKPVILVPGYYGCPMLCTLVLNGLIECLQDLKMNVGDHFEVVNYSIDPNEKPALAAAKKRSYLRGYGRPGAEQGWHFLTGDEPAIAKLSEEIGFHYLYDPSIKQYAHPSGFVVLTLQGRVSRYFFGVDYKAPELDSALVAASSNKTGSPIRQLFLLCFHYSPLTGKYANLIMMVVRSLAIGTVLGLGLLIGRSIVRDRAQKA